MVENCPLLVRSKKKKESLSRYACLKRGRKGALEWRERRDAIVVREASNRQNWRKKVPPPLNNSPRTRPSLGYVTLYNTDSGHTTAKAFFCFLFYTITKLGKQQKHHLTVVKENMKHENMKNDKVITPSYLTL